MPLKLQTADVSGVFRAMEMQDTTDFAARQAEKRAAHTLVDDDEDETIDLDSRVGSSQPGEPVALHDQDIQKPAPVHWPLQSDAGQVSLFLLHSSTLFALLL